jgi:excisionase family DNA binding protein
VPSKVQLAFWSNGRGSMTDSADHLAAAIRQVIDDAVEAALKAQRRPAPLQSIALKTVDERPPERMLYSLKELQQRLCVSRTTIYQLLSDGLLPSVKIGSRRLVTATALSAYVEALG